MSAVTLYFEIAGKNAFHCLVVTVTSENPVDFAVAEQVENYAAAAKVVMAELAQHSAAAAWSRSYLVEPACCEAVCQADYYQRGIDAP